MIDTLLRHKLALIGGIIVILIAFWYVGSPSASPTLVSTQVAKSGPEQDLIEALLALRAVKLQGTVFSEPAFRTLQDFSTQIVPEPVGRPNPFAPISNMFAPAASTTKEAQIFTPSKSKAAAPAH